MLKRATAVRTYSIGIASIVATTLLLTGCSTAAVEPTSAQVKSAVDAVVGGLRHDDRKQFLSGVEDTKSARVGWSYCEPALKNDPKISWDNSTTPSSIGIEVEVDHDQNAGCSLALEYKTSGKWIMHSWQGTSTTYQSRNATTQPSP